MKKSARPRYILPEEKWQRPGGLRFLWYMLGFCAYTHVVALWGMMRGVSYSSLGFGHWLFGAVGGAFLATGVHALRTGRMLRGSEYYRFEERTFTFVADAIMIMIAMLMALCGPIYFVFQELDKRAEAQVPMPHQHADVGTKAAP